MIVWSILGCIILYWVVGLFVVRWSIWMDHKIGLRRLNKWTDAVKGKQVIGSYKSFDDFLPLGLLQSYETISFGHMFLWPLMILISLACLGVSVARNIQPWLQTFVVDSVTTRKEYIEQYHQQCQNQRYQDFSRH